MTTAHHIRRAVPEDLPRILHVVDRAYMREYAIIPGPRLKNLEALRTEFDSPWNAFLVAEAAGKVVGVIRVTVPHPGSLHAQPIFGLLAVDPAAQGKGLGRRLVFAAEEWVLESGYTEMRLQCLDDFGLPQMYERMGYTVVSSSCETRWGSAKPFMLFLMRKRFLGCPEGNAPPPGKGEESVG